MFQQILSPVIAFRSATIMDEKTPHTPEALRRSLPSVRLREKFDALRDKHQIEDLKVWVQSTGVEEASIEDVASEVLAIVEAYESGNYEDITATIDKRDE